MLIAHVSDTHLGFRQYNSEEREADFYRAYEQIIDRLIEEHVDAVLHSGDLFDSPRPPTRALLVVQDSVLKLRERGIPLYAIPGGHDQLKRRGIPPHALYERLGMRVLTHRRPWDVLERGGQRVFVAGVQHVPKHLSETLVALLRRISEEARGYGRRVLMLHQSIKEVFPIEYELTLADLPRNFHYYAMGHIHRRLTLRFGDGVLAYSGSTEVWNRREYADYLRSGKGAYVVDLSGDEPCVHKVDLDCIRPHVIEEVRADDLQRGLRRVAASLRAHRVKPVVHLLIRGAVGRRSALSEVVRRALSPYALLVRLEFEAEAGEEAVDVSEAVSRLDLRALMREELRDERLAELAYTLFEALRREDVEGAKKVALEFYERGAL